MDGMTHLSESQVLAPRFVCLEYQELVSACDEASEIWRTRLHLAMLLGFASNESLDELARLKTNFGSAYSRLEAHRGSCEACHCAVLKYRE